MFIIVNKSNKALTNYTTGERAEFTNYDEACVVLETLTRYTAIQYEIKSID